MAKPMALHFSVEGPAPTSFLAAMPRLPGRRHRGWAIPMTPAHNAGLIPTASQFLLISPLVMSLASTRAYGLKGLTILISHYLRRPCSDVTEISGWNSVQNFLTSSIEHSLLRPAQHVVPRTTSTLVWSQAQRRAQIRDWCSSR